MPELAPVTTATFICGASCGCSLWNLTPVANRAAVLAERTILPNPCLILPRRIAPWEFARVTPGISPPDPGIVEMRISELSFGAFVAENGTR